MAEAIELEVVIDGKKFKANLKKVVEGESAKSGKRAGKKFQSGFDKSVRGGINNLSRTIAGLGTALAAAFAGRAIIRAAVEQENAVNALNASLRNIGKFSEAASGDLQNFAAGLQKVTRFGDETIISQLAFAQAMGASVGQSKKILAVSTDMAEALNIDLNSAVRNVTKTLGGYAGELGEVIPEMKRLSAEQLQAGEGITLLANKFKGFAAQARLTFAGSIQAASNAFGDLLEQIGFLITTNPVIIKQIGEFERLFLAFADAVSENAPHIQRNLKGILDTFLITPAKFWTDFFKPDASNNLAQTNAQIAETEKRIDAITKTISVMKSAGFMFSKASADDISKNNEELSKLLVKLMELKTLRTEFAALAPKPKEITGIDEEGVSEFEAQQQRLSAGFQKMANEGNRTGIILSQALVGSFNAVEGKMDDFVAKMGAMGKQVSSILLSGIANAAAGAFAAFGRALVTGENAMEAFGKAFIGAIGQMAIQLGAFFILAGIGYSFLIGFQGIGAALIAAGVGLSIFGGVLSAIAAKQQSKGIGGGAGASAGGAGGGDGPGFGAPETPFEAGVEPLEQEPRTVVNFTVQGDIFDSENTGKRVADLLNASFESDNVTLNQVTA